MVHEVECSGLFNSSLVYINQNSISYDVWVYKWEKTQNGNLLKLTILFFNMYIKCCYVRKQDARP